MTRLSTVLNQEGIAMSRTQGMWNRVLNVALVMAITAVAVIYLIGSVK
jgi:cation transporter-like permease